MKLIILNDRAAIQGGGDRIAIESARRLAELGHAVTFVAAAGPIGPELTGIQNLNTVLLGTACFKNDTNRFRAFRNSIWNRPAAAAFERLLASHNPADTLVHAHLYMGALSPSVLDVSIRKGFRTVLSLHDYFLTCPNGAYFVFPRNHACSLKPLGTSCALCHCDTRSRLHKPFRVLRGHLQRRARIAEGLRCVMPVSQICQQTIQRHLPSGLRSEVVPNFVSLACDAPVPVAENKAFMFSGRLEDYKGPQLLARAAVETGLPAVFCGVGPMEAAIRELNPTARLTGWVDKAGIAAEFRSARAFVFPSIVPETFGLAAAEALAMGVPVIASKATAAREFVSDGENGLLFEPGSVEDLGRKMRRLATDAALASRLGAQAHLTFWASSRYTLDGHIAKLEAVYQSLSDAN
jgi:glycosyltransferase involved in cell wall biosynthesis